jgi:hypothetical protein
VARQFKFEPGYRQAHWVKNCVAVGLAGGFFEPLEATGITMIELAAQLIEALFPWDDDFATAAKQYNRLMVSKYQSTTDFLKLHYCLTKRRDSAFWRDNADVSTIPDSLQDLLARWRHRTPGTIDIETNASIFSYINWQFVLYGMGFNSDLSVGRAAFPHTEVARQRFQEIRAQSAQALKLLPAHRDLLQQIKRPESSPNLVGQRAALFSRLY